MLVAVADVQVLQKHDPTPCSHCGHTLDSCCGPSHCPVCGQPTALRPSDEQSVRWALRRTLNKLAQLFALAQPEVDLDHRASGSVVCEMCGEEYRRHADDPHDPSGTTTMLCDGRRVHL